MPRYFTFGRPNLLGELTVSGAPLGSLCVTVLAYLVHYRQPAWCASAVASLTAAGANVTVIDNSGDLDLPVRVVRPGRNAGFTGGVNRALTEWLARTEPFVLVGSHDLHV